MTYSLDVIVSVRGFDFLDETQGTSAMSCKTRGEITHFLKTEWISVVSGVTRAECTYPLRAQRTSGMSGETRREWMHKLKTQMDISSVT